MPDPDGLLQRGVELLEAGKHGEALAALDETLAVNPDHAEAHYHRGVALRRLDRKKEALAAYDRAIALRPEVW